MKSAKEETRSDRPVKNIPRKKSASDSAYIIDFMGEKEGETIVLDDRSTSHVKSLNKLMSKQL
ncbi:hypothetical protein Plhal304r1_c004g0018111 [Plasmopara halstedii]